MSLSVTTCCPLFWERRAPPFSVLTWAVCQGVLASCALVAWPHLSLPFTCPPVSTYYLPCPVPRWGPEMNLTVSPGAPGAAGDRHVNGRGSTG